jgi:hypothetical protein
LTQSGKTKNSSLIPDRHSIVSAGAKKFGKSAAALQRLPLPVFSLESVFDLLPG